MIRVAHHRGGLALLLLAGCSGRPGTMTSTDAADSNTEACEGAVLEYRDVCFHAHSVEPVGYDHPLGLDGEPGHELVGVVDDRVGVYKFDGDGFMLVGEADAPPQVVINSRPSVIAGEFDEVPGLDLVVAETGDWTALYHLDEEGAPTLVGQAALAGGSSNAMRGAVAVGPDASGRWRVVAHFEDGPEFPGPDPLALWEVQGTALVQVERLDVQTELCDLYRCSGGDFDGDGRTDAVCSLRYFCTNDIAENAVHVVLLAQADGTVSPAAYLETVVESLVATDLDDDGITDLVGQGASDEIWYWLGDSTGGLGLVTRIHLPAPPTSNWNPVSAGDLDGDGDVEVVLGDHAHALVFDDVVGAPQTHAILEVNDASLRFPWVDVAIDVNADDIVDLPMSLKTLLMSELRP